MIEAASEPSDRPEANKRASCTFILDDASLQRVIGDIDPGSQEELKLPDLPSESKASDGILKHLGDLDDFLKEAEEELRQAAVAGDGTSPSKGE